MYLWPVEVEVKGPYQCSYMSLSAVNIGHIGYIKPAHFSQNSFIDDCGSQSGGHKMPSKKQINS